MSLGAWVLFAAATAYLIKLAGYLLPQSFLDFVGSMQLTKEPS